MYYNNRHYGKQVFLFHQGIAKVVWVSIKKNSYKRTKLQIVPSPTDSKPFVKATDIYVTQAHRTTNGSDINLLES